VRADRTVDDSDACQVEEGAFHAKGWLEGRGLMVAIKADEEVIDSSPKAQLELARQMDRNYSRGSVQMIDERRNTDFLAYVRSRSCATESGAAILNVMGVKSTSKNAKMPLFTW
jgi:hypothetical protein